MPRAQFLPGDQKHGAGQMGQGADDVVMTLPLDQMADREQCSLTRSGPSSARSRGRSEGGRKAARSTPLRSTVTLSDAAPRSSSPCASPLLTATTASALASASFDQPAGNAKRGNRLVSDPRRDDNWQTDLMAEPSGGYAIRIKVVYRWRRTASLHDEAGERRLERPSAASSGPVYMPPRRCGGIEDAEPAIHDGTPPLVRRRGGPIPRNACCVMGTTPPARRPCSSRLRSTRCRNRFSDEDTMRRLRGIRESVLNVSRRIGASAARRARGEAIAARPGDRRSRRRTPSSRPNLAKHHAHGRKDDAITPDAALLKCTTCRRPACSAHPRPTPHRGSSPAPNR